MSKNYHRILFTKERCCANEKNLCVDNFQIYSNILHLTYAHTYTQQFTSHFLQFREWKSRSRIGSFFTVVPVYLKHIRQCDKAMLTRHLGTYIHTNDYFKLTTNGRLWWFVCKMYIVLLYRAAKRFRYMFVAKIQLPGLVYHKGMYNSNKYNQFQLDAIFQLLHE